MTKLANQITVIATPNQISGLFIDDQEFPWFIAEEGITTTIANNGAPAITISILANRVTTEHKIG